MSGYEIYTHPYLFHKLQTECKMISGFKKNYGGQIWKMIYSEWE